MPGPKFNFTATGFPSLLLELSRHEPGRNTRPGGDGLPDFLRRAGDLDFNLDGTASGGFFLHAHDGSLGLDFCGRGFGVSCMGPKPSELQPEDDPAENRGYE